MDRMVKFPQRKLLRVPYEENDLVASYSAFGRDTYKSNIEEMSKNYSHPQTGKKMTFVPASTSESLLVFFSGFENSIEPKIFDPWGLQLGYIVKTQDGVYVNTTELNEKNLKKLIDKSEKFNGIYILPNGVVEGVRDFAFAPYESFKIGVQESGKFAEGGLARALEHTSEKVAKNLKEISSSKFYNNGVLVWGFYNFNNPILRIASLGFMEDLGGEGFVVGGDSWQDSDRGYAFGLERIAE